VESYKGLITLPDVRTFLLEEFQDALYDPTFDYLCDLRKAQIEMTGNDLDEMSTFLEALKDDVKPHKCALLADTPGQVASATLYTELLKSFPVDIELFTTTEAAIQWLNKSISIIPQVKKYISIHTIEDKF
jgi:hypothetical protein